MKQSKKGKSYILSNLKIPTVWFKWIRRWGLVLANSLFKMHRCGRKGRKIKLAKHISKVSNSYI